MLRQPLKQVSIGGTGVGKTFENMRFIKEVYSNPKLPDARKCLIYDVNKEFKDIKPIAPEDIPHFIRQKKIEIRRVLPDDAYGNELGMDEKYELLCDMVDNYQFRNGLLYLEDINNYVTTANTKHLINLLTTNRHKLLDILISLQTLVDLPPRIWGNVNVLNIHKANDDPFQSRIKNQISGKIEPLRIANIMVTTKTQFDPRFFCTFNFGTLKITGKFTTPDFIDACEKYLALNRRLVQDQMVMNSISKDEAQRRLLVQLMQKYNGNVQLKSKK